MALTPLIMMASESLLATDPAAIGPNDPLAIVPIDTGSYLNQVIVADYRNTLADFTASALIDPTLATDFAERLDDTAPYISDSGKNSIVPGVTANYTTIINQHVLNLFPSVQEYVQYVMIAMGQKEQANRYVNSAVNGVCEETFTSQDSLMTGGIAGVSSSAQAWGAELLKTGPLFDFNKIDYVGTPQAIIEALMRANTIGSISEELDAQGIDVVTLVSTIDANPDQRVSPKVQKRCYDAFLQVTGEKLRKVLEAMSFTIPNITTLADLLDLTKIFPATFATLTFPVAGELQNIFTAGGALTSYTNALTPPIISVIPLNLAKSNYAFIISLGQIKCISNTSPTDLGDTASGIEDNTGLTNTGGLTVALPPDTSNFFIADMGGGRGPDGTFYLMDLVGAPAGMPDNQNIIIMVTHFTYLQGVGGFAGIAEVLSVMRGVLADLYSIYVDIGSGPVFDRIEIPRPFVAGSTIPGTGIYATYDLAIEALLLELDTAVADYMLAYPIRHDLLLAAFGNSLNSVVAGIRQLWFAEIMFNATFVPGFETSDNTNEPGASVDPLVDGIPANKKTTLAFAENLHQYGKKTDKGNIVEILATMATDTQGGDAIIAAMREGRNLDKLSAAGICNDNEIDDQPAYVEPGNIS